MDADSVAKELVNQAQMGYWDRLIRGIDMFSNVLIGGPLSDTISSRIARWSTTGKKIPCQLCILLGIIFRDQEHCKNALLADTARAGLEMQRDNVAPE
jgi:hypothetical protein